MEEYRSHALSVSSCKYHFVWCPKYRHPVLNVVEDDVREVFGETADQVRARDSLLGDCRRPRTPVRANSPEVKPCEHRSAIQVVLWQALAGVVSRDSGVVFLGRRILEGRILRGDYWRGIGGNG